MEQQIKQLPNEVKYLIPKNIPLEYIWEKIKNNKWMYTNNIEGKIIFLKRFTNETDFMLLLNGGFMRITDLIINHKANIHFGIYLYSLYKNIQIAKNCIEWLFNTFNLKRLTGIFAKNEKSLVKYAERLGFEKECDLKYFLQLPYTNELIDGVMYSIIY